MHEIWLQKYIKENYRKIGFTELHGPYNYGADFKGLYQGKLAKVEAEWEYADYVSHKHSLKFADILVVATLEPVPETLKLKLPAFIINLDPEQVIAWAQPRMVKKIAEDYSSYPWRKFAQSLLHLYAYYRKQSHLKDDFIGSHLVRSNYLSQKPEGFRFASGGKEESFAGTIEDKSAWDYWLKMAHEVAEQFRLKPTLLHPTWIDRVAVYYNHTGRITEGESKRFQEVAAFIDDLIQSPNQLP